MMRSTTNQRQVVDASTTNSSVRSCCFVVLSKASRCPWLVMYALAVFNGLVMISVRAQDFGYDGDEGPSHWGEQYGTCFGKHQSPININLLTVKRVELSPLRFTGFDDEIVFNVTNNGHTAQLSLASKPGSDVTVTGGPLTGVYEFSQLHFHWGDNDTFGSEDRIAGHSFPMELHMVFYKRSYRNARSALDHADGLAVLAFFYQIEREDNPAYEPLTRALRHDLTLADSHATLPRGGSTLTSLLPDRNHPGTDSNRSGNAHSDHPGDTDTSDDDKMADDDRLPPVRRRTTDAAGSVRTSPPETNHGTTDTRDAEGTPAVGEESNQGDDRENDQGGRLLNGEDPIKRESSGSGALSRSPYFTYNGSLTTPPCSEVVVWLDFEEPIRLSHKQIEAFRTLHTKHGNHLLTHNSRPVQPLGDRVVLYNQPAVSHPDHGINNNDKNNIAEKEESNDPRDENVPEEIPKENDISSYSSGGGGGGGSHGNQLHREDGRTNGNMAEPHDGSDSSADSIVKFSSSNSLHLMSLLLLSSVVFVVSDICTNT